MSNARDLADNRKLTLDTVKASSSGVEVPFTNIPPWVKRLTLVLNHVSLNGDVDILVQIGDSGGITNSGYLSSGTNFFSGATTTAGYLVRMANNGFAFSGTITLINISGNTWVASVCGSTYNGTYSAVVGGGTKTLTGTLDRVRLVSANGTSTFDAGSVNIIYE